jgi:flagellar hook-associated protein 2
MVTSVSSTSGSTGTTSSSTSSASSTGSTVNKAATGQNAMKALGSGSGIDTASLAQSLVDAERAPRADAINKNIKKSEAIVSGYAAVKYALSAVKTAFDDLKDASDFSSVTASSNQTDIFSVSTTTRTQPGSHSILVTQLAQEQRSASTQSFTSASEVITTQPLNLFINGANLPSIAVTTATPAGVVEAINKAGKGLSAQLVNTGNGYKITVTGASGGSNAFVLSSDAAGLDFGAISLNRPQISQSAQAFATEDTAMSGSPINLTLNGDATNPIVVDPPTPAAFVAAFNGSSAAQAKGLSANYYGGKLTITSPSGSANAFSLLTDNGDALAFVQKQSAKDLCMTKPLQEAKDAALQVDGLPITSTGNAVSDVIPGVTLNLTGTNATSVNGFVQATGAAATLSLANDTSVAKAKLNALVTAYNDASDLLDQVTNPKSSLATYGGTLVGNSSVRSLRDQLRQMITNTPSTSGGSDGTGPARSLSALRDIGIEINSKGKLTTNSVTLDLALNFNFADTVTLLSGNQENQPSSDISASGLAGDASKSLAAMLSASGTISVETDNANKRISKYQDDLTALEDRMTMILARYQKQFSAMDSMVGQTKNTQTGLTSTFAGMMAMYTNK